MESSIKKTVGFVNNPENFSTKKGKNIPCGYSVSTLYAFNNVENKYTLYCEKSVWNLYGIRKTKCKLCDWFLEYETLNNL